jgi:class 3 adenylate cyclase/DNA-binding CsgD family transcriptional regulator
MDRHDIDAWTLEELAHAHARDLEVQERYGCNYLTYFCDQRTRSIFCLVEAPSTDAALSVHREAHGGMPSEIIEVDYNSLNEYIGGFREPASGEVFEASAFRIILLSSIEDISSLIRQFGDTRAMQIVREHERLAREQLEPRGGREVNRGSGGMMGCFPSVVGAVECALAIRDSINQFNAKSATPIPARIGLSAGEPVQDNGQLFGAAVQLASAISLNAQPGSVMVAGVVRELCLGKGFLFEDRGEFTPSGLDEPVRLYEVRGRDAGSQPPVAVAPGTYPDRLSAREVEVLRLIARGRTNQEIANELVISLNTVTRHVSNIFDKTSVNNRAEAASYAHLHDLT